jgi:hypothetical protein
VLLGGVVPDVSTTFLPDTSAFICPTCSNPKHKTLLHCTTPHPQGHHLNNIVRGELHIYAINLFHSSLCTVTTTWISCWHALLCCSGDLSSNQAINNFIWHTHSLQTNSNCNREVSIHRRLYNCE